MKLKLKMENAQKKLNNNEIKVGQILYKTGVQFVPLTITAITDGEISAGSAIVADGSYYITKKEDSTMKFYNKLLDENIAIKNINKVKLFKQPQPRYGHSSHKKRKMYIFGGISNINGEKLNDLWYFDMSNNFWNHITDLSFGGEGVNCCIKDDELHFIHGSKNYFKDIKVENDLLKLETHYQFVNDSSITLGLERVSNPAITSYKRLF